MSKSPQQSDELFRLLVEGVKDYAIFMLDPEGCVASWNRGAELIKGYRADEILGRHFSAFYPADAIARGWPEHELQMAQSEGCFEDEGWRVRKDGSLFWSNVIITALYDHDNQLRGFAKVTRDLTERRRIEALEEADAHRNEFLAMLSHELRNPLAPIKNALAVMRLCGVSEPSLDWARTVVERQVSHLTRLVDDLLDVSRIAVGKITLQRKTLEIAQVVAGAVEASRPLIDSRGHHLTVEVPQEPLTVEGDLTRLSQVLTNLLNNAAKYTPPPGEIRLTAGKEEGGMVAVRVRDTGVGIAADLMPKIFDLFTQGERPLDRSEGGLGIGLTLAQRLVKLHGGSIEAASEGPGRGSELVIRLPLSAVPAASSSSSRRPAESRPASSRRVLVVDDNRDAAESLETLLQLWGHRARSAQDGPQALALMAELQPEIVLLDIGLPGMDGYEVARRMRELPAGKSALIVAVTGYGRNSDRLQSHQAGFDHHLVKPVQPEVLQELIGSAKVACGGC
ncbi:MAG: ATP-binding protein [Thermoanaerobaculia bacterium]